MSYLHAFKELKKHWVLIFLLILIHFMNLILSPSCIKLSKPWTVGGIEIYLSWVKSLLLNPCCCPSFSTFFLCFVSIFLKYFLRSWIICFLRVRAFFHKTVRVCHVYCNFKIGFTCRITVIFGTLKDGSLLINTLASNICFSHRNMFQNGVDALSKIVNAFLSKSSKFRLVRIIR